MPVRAKELHLGREVGPVERAQQPPREPVHGCGEDEVQEHRRAETAHQRPRRRALAEHEMDEEQAEAVEDGDDRDRQERRVRAVAARRLAVAADPVARDGEHESGQPELPERRDVDEDAAEEPAHRAEHRAAQERDGDE